VTTLADLTTLRLGGPAADLVVAEDERTLVEAVRAADATGTPALVVSGGSNLVVADAGYAGTAVLVRTRGVHVESDMCGGAYVTVAAGEEWDSFVARAVGEEWQGIECLAGIPGSVGATPVQNVGAYGQEVGAALARVRTFDRVAGEQRTFMHADLGLGYRTSRLKAEAGRYLVLDATFQMKLSATSSPLADAELARSLGAEVGARAPLAEVREAVLALRRSKGMVLDPADHDTWSAGSFFTNPILSSADAAALPDDAPRWPAGDGRVKTSAAWLIERAGFAKGYGDGPVTLSTKHTLALTNRGGARTEDLLALAREVRNGVDARFGVVLEPEPVLVGCSLDA
jgi:UDP-N-acetylmuramate dehydrogenase